MINVILSANKLRLHYSGYSGSMRDILESKLTELALHQQELDNGKWSSFPEGVQNNLQKSIHHDSASFKELLAKQSKQKLQKNLTA